MDRSWWLVIAAVVLLAVVAALVDGWGRRHPSGRRRPPGLPSGPRRGTRPRPAEIWWATVPFEDGPGGKDRPCLVLAVGRRTALVAKITSKYHDERAGVIALPSGSVGDAHGRTSYLESGELRDVRLGDFRRRVGTVDPSVWDRVRHLAG
ncbi:type II toxin-antitoxin system PemK/MazF family toxin [Streptomyces fructofermentans]|uniref:type II toxin-antitoxin system PemK/MazF family toxin n=1 Tax=Streptomyces fructofermentans TaxID=152141 RepID=UPI0033E0C84A